MAEQPLSNIMEAGWAAALEPVAGRIAAMGAFLRAAREMRERGTFEFAKQAAGTQEISAMLD